MTALTIDQILRENEDLRRRLEEAEDALRAIRAGEVDAIVVETEGEQVYTLETAYKTYRLLVEQMPYSAATLTAAGEIIYCNRRFADLLGQPLPLFAREAYRRLRRSRRPAAPPGSAARRPGRRGPGGGHPARARWRAGAVLPRSQRFAGRGSRLVPYGHRPDRPAALPGVAAHPGCSARHQRAAGVGPGGRPHRHI